MTKKEITEIIESKAAEYGFTMQENTVGWANESDRDTCIRIEIRKETDYEKMDWEARKVCQSIKANASICQMGENPTPEELLKTAEEIAKGAKFATEINRMGLFYERTF